MYDRQVQLKLNYLTLNSLPTTNAPQRHLTVQSQAGSKVATQFGDIIQQAARRKAELKKKICKKMQHARWNLLIDPPKH